MTSLHREIAEVPKPLLQVFRQLVTGHAKWPLYLYGAPGRGKTCAALALLDHVQHGIYTTVSDLVAKAATVMNRGPGVAWHLAEPGKCQLMVLDELGTREKVGDFHYETVQRAIDIRQGAPLVLISNLNLETLARVYDARIASRAGAGTVVELKGRDRRIE